MLTPRKEVGSEVPLSGRRIQYAKLLALRGKGGSQKEAPVAGRGGPKETGCK